MFVHFTDYCIISHFAKKKKKNLGGLRLTHIEYLHIISAAYKDFSTDKMPSLYSNFT